MQGRIIKALAGFYYVEHDGVVYQTRARGNFRKKGQTPYVGDFVEFSAEENSEGYILKIGQRINSLVRPPIVNIDQAVVIMSVKEPDFNCNLLAFLSSSGNISDPSSLFTDIIQQCFYIFELFTGIQFSVNIHIRRRPALFQAISCPQFKSSIR